MKRLALKFLGNWRIRPQRRPLLLRGARQVGKTWLVRAHAASYESFVEINLEKQAQFIPLFQKKFGDPQQLIRELSLLSGQKIEIGKTLLFIDEIQECKEALLSLRYFKEELSEQAVIAAGSLLEFIFSELSFPVGRIEFLHLFPLNFEEFLMALNREDLVETIKLQDVSRTLAEPLHELLLDYFTTYSLLGGLPEIVKCYAESKDLKLCQNIQQLLIASYREDFHKYAKKTQIQNLRLLFENVPRLLGQKFKYSEIDCELKSRDLSLALTLLEQAGLVYKVYHSSSNGVPLHAQIDPKKFKVFSLDIGLCHRLLGLELSQLYLEKKNLLARRGGIAEQIVAQELISYTPQNESPQLHYWHRETAASSAEMDFVIGKNGQVFPLEVKSQRARSSKSMGIFLEEKKIYANKGFIISKENFSFHDKVQKLPFYALLRNLREQISI
ncbi:MAG: ATP-binding protein [Deltaproteobacteria bacterium]|nr:ATP-binding protein [Deltaproteobacteria bacterium]